MPTMTTTTVTLSANQAAGTDPILADTRYRKLIMFRAPADFEIALAASATVGQRIYASARDSLAGPECPTNPIYLVSGSGLSTGQTIVMWGY